jgi:hypothetical protein
MRYLQAAEEATCNALPCRYDSHTNTCSDTTDVHSPQVVAGVPAADAAVLATSYIVMLLAGILVRLLVLEQQPDGQWATAVIAAYLLCMQRISTWKTESSWIITQFYGLFGCCKARRVRSHIRQMAADMQCRHTGRGCRSHFSAGAADLRGRAPGTS